ncbi:efflux RND transporter periplasmic adaptor subunit [Lacinutrix sp. C3R15]|uniref:efflux RND transporter periplasmic adaptor subunit n=1 Tax=Flavobacteriaceae TaxID=49546 RepID=UPI001C084D09|nr:MULTISPECIES: efflux RND transporter periplasmic adaptor subunit [Flavobacteriaceae]MBU2939772.1 efflux RND transporter periplasmic adaptor subunit [Lacinutrix sp. C3R15]MDO6623087.1 efflux RND transporter periplasmic adaptor subunit [Oceanihabitans sp. 1_MG-2023]
MKKHYLLILLTLVLSCNKTSDKILPTEQNVTESVYSSVTIQPDSLYQAYATVAGILEKNFTEEGDVIKKNQAISQIINNTPILNTQNAKLALDLAKENYNGSAAILAGIKDEIEAANLKYKNDSIHFFRQQNLWKQNIGSKADFDAKELNYQLSQNNLTLLKNKYNQTKNQLKTSVKQAQNNYQTSLISTKDFTVKSAINGKVYALYKASGELVNTMEPVAAIGSASTFIIEMLVDEVDIVKITKNQEVLITLDAYTGKVLQGKVSKIYPKKDERNQTFKVEAVFVNPPEVLYPGLSGEANIIISKKEKVLTIPKSYLINNNQVKTENGIVSITTGLENMEFIEVLSGITKDTYIYKPE